MAITMHPLLTHILSQTYNEVNTQTNLWHQIMALISSPELKQNRYFLNDKGQVRNMDLMGNNITELPTNI